MRWIETVSNAEATGRLADVSAGIRQRRWSIVNMVWAASTHPPVMQALLNLYQARHASCCYRSALAACDGKDAYGLFHVSLFAIMAHLADISAGFIGEIRGCTFLLCKVGEHFALLMRVRGLGITRRCL